MSQSLAVVKEFGQLLKQVPQDEADLPDWVQRTLALVDPDVHIPVAASLPYGGDYHGHEGFLTMGAGFGETWEVVDGGTYRYFPAGEDQVLLLVDPTFRSRATGKSVSFRMAEVLTVRNGLITELVPFYFDTVPLVEALS